MADFKKLQVWQKAHALALSANTSAGRIRGATYSSLRSQLVRAAMSIDANIVEGRGQRTDKEFARYLSIAINSTNELESHLIMARDIGAMGVHEFSTLLDQLIEVRRMLHGLLNRITTSKLSTTPRAD
jgi:four helix bundle protein